MKSVYYYLDLAIQTAKRGDDDRRYLLGAVGIRADGVLVRSSNGAPARPTMDTHAEARISRKLDFGSIVFVARVLKLDGSLAMARPCKACLRRLLSRRISKVYYTINSSEFGWIDFDRNTENKKKGTAFAV